MTIRRDAPRQGVSLRLAGPSGDIRHHLVERGHRHEQPSADLDRRSLAALRIKMAQEHKKRLGRPPKAPTPGKRVALGLKVTSEIKQQLDEEARKHGRTQSQQAELMIERAFAEERGFGGPEMRQVAYLMGAAFAMAAQRAAVGKPDWITDPRTYGEGVAGVLDALLIGFPNGDNKALELEALVGRLLSRLMREKEGNR
jgi:hypothetical protein